MESIKEKRKNKEVFCDFFLKRMLPTVTGKATASEYHNKKLVSQVVPFSCEAFCYLALENSYCLWLDHAEEVLNLKSPSDEASAGTKRKAARNKKTRASRRRKNDGDHTHVDDTEKNEDNTVDDVKAVYTGKRKTDHLGGWGVEANQRYNKIMEEVKKDREENRNVEKEFLKQNKKEPRKRKKKRKVEDENHVMANDSMDWVPPTIETDSNGTPDQDDESGDDCSDRSDEEDGEAFKSVAV